MNERVSTLILGREASCDFRPPVRCGESRASFSSDLHVDRVGDMRKIFAQKCSQRHAKNLREGLRA